MERYFKVTVESTLHKEWFDYISNRDKVQELVKSFTAEHGIESVEYYADDKSFHIVPTEKDNENFGNSLCQPIENGLCKFKASTKIGKAWVKVLKDAELKVMCKPMVILYFKGFGGRYRSRLFDHDGVVYCSIDPAHDTPKGFEEIKASEFFKIIEDSEKVAV